MAISPSIWSATTRPRIPCVRYKLYTTQNFNKCFLFSFKIDFPAVTLPESLLVWFEIKQKTLHHEMEKIHYILYSFLWCSLRKKEEKFLLRNFPKNSANQIITRIPCTVCVLVSSWNFKLEFLYLDTWLKKVQTFSWRPKNFRVAVCSATTDP